MGYWKGSESHWTKMWEMGSLCGSCIFCVCGALTLSLAHAAHWGNVCVHPLFSAEECVAITLQLQVCLCLCVCVCAFFYLLVLLWLFKFWSPMCASQAPALGKNMQAILLIPPNTLCQLLCRLHGVWCHAFVLSLFICATARTATG